MIYHLWLFCRWGIRHHPNLELRMTLALLRWRLDLTRVLFKNFITLIKWTIAFCLYTHLSCGGLESTDVAGRVLHLSLTWLTWRWCRVWGFFFFFFLGFTPTRLNSHWFGFDSRRTVLIRPESSRISHIGSYWSVTETAETGRNRPWIWPEQLKFSSLSVFAFFFLCFVNQG